MHITNSHASSPYYPRWSPQTKRELRYPRHHWISLKTNAIGVFAQDMRNGVRASQCTSSGNSNNQTVLARFHRVNQREPRFASFADFLASEPHLCGVYMDLIWEEDDDGFVTQWRDKIPQEEWYQEWRKGAMKKEKGLLKKMFFLYESRC